MSRLLRLIFLAASLLTLQLWHPSPSALPTPASGALFAAIVALIVTASFGVLKEANALSARLGEPYGSLILTISVLLIEILLIAAVLLGPTPSPQIGRDSVFSVMMIIVNLVLGAALIVGRRRKNCGAVSTRSTLVYVALIAAFGSVTFLAPRLFSPFTGAFPWPWSLAVAMLIAGGYIVFLYLQMGPLRSLFKEPTTTAEAAPATGSTGRSTTFLVLFLAAVALLGKHLASFIDYGVAELGVPAGLGGLLIGALVFTPETLTTLSAARSGQMQRVANLCLGAFVSTVGMTVPTILVLGAGSGREVVFALGAADSVLFLATVVLSALTFARPRPSAALGVAHLSLFAAFGATLML